MLKTRQHDAAAWIYMSSVVDGFDESVRDSEKKGHTHVRHGDIITVFPPVSYM